MNKQLDNKKKLLNIPQKINKTNVNKLSEDMVFTYLYIRRLKLRTHSYSTTLRKLDISAVTS
jgi:hypothetical protein